jgi:hypothetical protein
VGSLVLALAVFVATFAGAAQATDPMQVGLFGCVLNDAPS